MHVTRHMLHLARDGYCGTASGMSVEPFCITSDTEHCSLLMWSVSLFYVFHCNHVFFAEDCIYYGFCEFYASSTRLWIRGSFSVYSNTCRFLNSQYHFDLIPLGLNGFRIMKYSELSNGAYIDHSSYRWFFSLLLPYLGSSANDKYSIWISPLFAGLKIMLSIRSKCAFGSYFHSYTGRIPVLCQFSLTAKGSGFQ